MKINTNSFQIFSKNSSSRRNTPKPFYEASITLVSKLDKDTTINIYRPDGHSCHVPEDYKIDVKLKASKTKSFTL